MADEHTLDTILENEESLCLPSAPSLVDDVSHLFGVGFRELAPDDFLSSIGGDDDVGAEQAGVQRDGGDILQGEGGGVAVDQIGVAFTQGHAVVVDDEDIGTYDVAAARDGGFEGNRWKFLII